MLEGGYGITAQVVAGIVVVVCIYLMSLWIIQRDQLVSDTNDLREPRLQIKVMDGYATGHAMSDRNWSTINQDAANFLSLKRSYNRRGGAQFSYSFWMRVANTTAANVASRTILMRGDKTLYNWVKQTSTDPQFGSVSGSTSEYFNDVLVKCPLIRFGDSYGTFVIELNTLADPSAKIHISSDPAMTYDGSLVTAALASDDPTLRHNAMSLTSGKWAMYTFTFEDHVAISDFEDGIMVRFYLNDTLYHTQALRSSMRQNYGDLYLMPTILPPTSDTASISQMLSTASAYADASSVMDGSVGNLSYFNYALTLPEVSSMFRNGPPTYPSQMMNGSLSQPLYLSEYNRLDVYNT